MEGKREKLKRVKRDTRINITNNNNFGCLPEELITEIFLRLPVKSLGKFNLVCKTWRSLISNPIFHKSHLQFSICNPPSSSTLLVFTDKDGIRSLNVKHNNNGDGDGNGNGVLGTVDEGSLIPLNYSQFYNPLGSCHGLICIQNFRSHQVCVLNPVTKERRILHSFPTYMSSIDQYVIASGFGYVPSIDNYKVVVVLVLYKRISERHVFVLSLKSDDEWKELDSNTISVNGALNQLFPSGPRLTSSQVVSFNEALYWIVVPEQNINAGHHGSCFLVKFDLVREVFERVSNLKQINHGIGNQNERFYNLETSIGIIGQDTLSVGQLFCQSSVTSFLEMWTLEQNGKWDSWKRLFRVKLDLKYFGHFGQPSHNLLGFLSTCTALVVDKGGRRPSVISLVDPNQDPPEHHVLVARNMANYVPSLISPCNDSRQVPI